MCAFRCGFAEEVVVAVILRLEHLSFLARLAGRPVGPYRDAVFTPPGEPLTHSLSYSAFLDASVAPGCVTNAASESLEGLGCVPLVLPLLNHMADDSLSHALGLKFFISFRRKSAIFGGACVCA